MEEFLVNKKICFQQCSEQFFDYLNDSLKNPETFEGVNVGRDIKDLVGRLIKVIKERDFVKSEFSDYTLNGVLELLTLFLSHFPEAISDEERSKFFSYILWDCLFKRHKQPGDIENPPKFKNLETRNQALKLVFLFVNLNKDGEQVKFIQVFRKLMAEARWRNVNKKSWQYTGKNLQIKRSPYVGLKNLSNTCYMNSVMQQLFMMPAFRQAILEVRDPHPEIPSYRNTLFQTKLMFAALLESEKQSFNTHFFFNSLRDVSGEKFNQIEQKDADEYFIRYMDIIDESMKGTVEAKTLHNLVEGKFANQLIGIECPHKSLREEPFITIPVKVKNKKSL